MPEGKFEPIVLGFMEGISASELMPAMTGMYILDEDNNPVHARTMIEHSRWIVANQDRLRVGETLVGDWRVSTVFLKYDHAMSGEEPLLFETMLFWRGEGEQDRDHEQVRCSTWEQAEEQHQRMVESLNLSSCCS